MVKFLCNKVNLMLTLKSRTRNAPSQSLLTPTPSWSTPMLWASSCATIKAPLPRLWASDIVQDAWIGHMTFCLLIQKLKRQRPVSYTCLTNRPFRYCHRHQTDCNKKQTLKIGGFSRSYTWRTGRPLSREGHGPNLSPLKHHCFRKDRDLPM